NIHAREILLGMRSKMDLYANVRPVRLMDASLCPLKGIEPRDLDFVVIRENTEGVYGDLGGVFKQGTSDEVAIQEDINTRKGVERIIRYAFEYCASGRKIDGSPRRRVLMCDKSNAMTHAGGLWQRVFKKSRRSIRVSSRSTCMWTRCACSWCAIRGNSMSSLPTTCLATSSPILRRDCREGWGWRRAAICIRVVLHRVISGCSSRCMVQRRRLRGKTLPIPWARF